MTANKELTESSVTLTATQQEILKILTLTSAQILIRDKAKLVARKNELDAVFQLPRVVLRAHVLKTYAEEYVDEELEKLLFSCAEIWSCIHDMLKDIDLQESISIKEREVRKQTVEYIEDDA